MITPADTPPQRPDQMPVSGFDILAPYAVGPEHHVQVHGDPDAGGGDKISQSVDGAVAAAMARQAQMATDNGAGKVIGDLMHMPGNGLDPGVGSLGITDPSGGFYDPPRDYGGSSDHA